MSVIDDRGRLFGRINLIDAIVLAVVGMLVPLAYAAYLLFRSPPATLTAVEPASMVMEPNARVRVTGANLRPFMRVSFNDEQGRTFLIGSTTSAEIDLPDLAPGTYDVVLYDYAQELSRLPKAFTVLPPVPAPTAQLVASGYFIGLTKEQAGALKAGLQFPADKSSAAEILATGTPEPSTARVRNGSTAVHIALQGQVQLPATLRVTCWLENNADGSLRCVTAGRQQAATVTPDAIVNLKSPLADEWLNFQVAEVFPATRPAFSTVRVRATTTWPTVLANAKAGDRDVAGPLFTDSWVGTIVSRDPGMEFTLRLPVQRGSEGWQYRTHPLKAGRGLRFETPTYVLDAIILEFTEPQTAQ
jgi:hypothetical protein